VVVAGDAFLGYDRRLCNLDGSFANVYDYLSLPLLICRVFTGTPTNRWKVIGVHISSPEAFDGQF